MPDRMDIQPRGRSKGIAPAAPAGVFTIKPRSNFPIPIALMFGALVATAAPALITNSVGLKLVRIDPGSFEMGHNGPPSDYVMTRHPTKVDAAEWDEKPVHRVTISQPFHLGATEVTLAAYRQFRPNHRPGDAPDAAAVQVSWHDAVEFCAWLSAREGRTYRLPTEAEWEYACRAGTTTVFNTGDALPAGFQKWYRDLASRALYFPKGEMPPEVSWSAGEVSLRVAGTPPNAWGLYDMHGNVAEWCHDWYGPYEHGEKIDPSGRSAGDFRVIRGGSHSSLPASLRSANRAGWIPQARNEVTGFRVVLGPLPQGKTLPPPPPGRHARDVDQSTAKIVRPAGGQPFFSGPLQYVKIPPGSLGPLFSSHNHRVGLTECPNGDLLAVWFSCVQESGAELANAASRLRHGAQEWEDASVFWDAPDVNDHAPKLWWDGGRKLYHFARGFTENIVRESIDNGATWSGPMVFYPHGELGSHPIRTREGLYVVAHDSSAVSLTASLDQGLTWTTLDATRGPSDVRAGGQGLRQAGIHTPLVELADGRLMAVGRLHFPQEQAAFGGMMPISYTADLGRTWTYVASEFPVVSQRQRPILLRMEEGPLLLISFTDQWREWKERKGLDFFAADGTVFRGYGMFAALSEDEGKTWPVRRLLAPGGPARVIETINKVECTLTDTLAEPTGYLAAIQSRDGLVHLLTSKNHYRFNLTWLRQRPVPPRN